jgi:hypothetical protein
MVIRFAVAGGALGILAGVLFGEANATTLTETGSFSDTISVADGSSKTDQIALAPFDPNLGALTYTSVTVTTNATFNGFADVPSIFPGGLNALATTTANYNLSSYGLGSISQPLYVQDVCPGPCQGISPIATFSQSQTNTVNGASPLAFGGNIPVNISTSQQTFGGTIIGSQSINGTASVTFTYIPIPITPIIIVPSISAFPAVSQLASSLPTFLSNNQNSLDLGVYQYLLPIANALAVVKPQIGAVGNTLQSAGVAYGIIDALSSGNPAEVQEKTALLLAGQYLSPNSQLLFDGGITAISALRDLAQGNPVKALIDINAYIWGNVVAVQAQQFAKSDPPDPNYTQLYIPPVVALPNITTGIANLDIAFQKANMDGLGAALYLQAGIISINRYSSALLAGDAFSAMLQLEALSYYLQLYNGAISNGVADMTTLRSILENEGLLGSVLTADLLAELQQDLAMNGFDPSVVANLEGLGLMDIDIEHALQSILELQPFGLDALSLNISAIPDILVSGEIPTVPTPEPSSLVLFVGALLSLMAGRILPIIQKRGSFALPTLAVCGNYDRNEDHEYDNRLWKAEGSTRCV